MAYSNLATGVAWGSSPVIYLSFAQDNRRSGANMQYRLRITVASLTDPHYFGFPIHATIKLDGTTRVSGATIKNASPSTWGSSIVYETDWITVANKSTGNVVAAFTIYSSDGSSRSATYNYSLPVSPAASTIAVSHGTLGAAQTIAVTRYDPGFTHTITAVCGSASTTIASKSGSISISFTPPISWASQGPASTAVPVRYTIDTYSGNTKIGTSAVTVSCAIPASVVPTVSMAVSDPTGNVARYGGYIQNQSKAKVDLTAGGAYGSTIKGYQITVGSLNGDKNNASFALPTSGTISITAKVVDSRGRSATEKTTINVRAYKSPTVAIQTMYRCDSNGNEAQEGNYAYILISYSITALANQNTAAIRVSYRQKGTSYWTTRTVDNNRDIIIPAAADKAYEVMAVCVDDFVTQQSKIREIAIAFVHVQVDMDRRSISFGELVTRDHTFSVAMETIFRSTVALEKAPVADADAVNKGYLGSRFQCGWFDPGEVAAGSTKDYAVTFKRAFAKTPRVLVTPYQDTTSKGYSQLAIVVTAQSPTGFTVRFLSSYEYSLHPTINWLAATEE